MDTPVFYIFLFLHLISLIVGFGAVFVIDTFGLLWLVKKVPITRVVSVARITQVLIWIGWAGLVISGTVLISIKHHIDSLTVIKLFFVLLLGLNGLYLHFTKKNFESLHDTDSVPMLYRLRIGLASGTRIFLREEAGLPRMDQLWNSFSSGKGTIFGFLAKKWMDPARSSGSNLIRPPNPISMSS
jgi:hypothetical protein